MLQGLAAGLCCSAACARSECKHFGGCNFPRVGFVDDEATNFRLSVRILSASIPSLPAPGLFMRRRPKVEVTIGREVRETGLGEYRPGQVSSSHACGSSMTCGLGAPSTCEGRPRNYDAECEWKFGDALTLTVGLHDLLGPGLRIRLTAHGEVRLGVLQLDLAQSEDWGDCVIDLRHRVLRSCVNESAREPDGSVEREGKVWSSPVLVIPVGVAPQVVPDKMTRPPGQQAAFVAVAFALDVDPEAMTRLAEETERPLAERLTSGFPLMARCRTGSEEWTSSCSKCGHRDPRDVVDARSKDLPVASAVSRSNAEIGPSSAWRPITDIGMFQGEHHDCIPMRGRPTYRDVGMQPKGVGPRELPAPDVSNRGRAQGVSAPLRD